MTKILVTGGTGYIGSHTTVELQQAGFEVLIIDNLSNSDIKVLDGIEKITGKRPEFFEFDLCDEIKVYKFFKKNEVDAVIHLAGLKAVGESVEKPLEYYKNNLVSTLNILQALPRESLKNFIFSSSATVYGVPDKLPLTEDSPVKPATNAYGATKQINEQIMFDLARCDKNFSGIIFRYFNICGAHPSSLIGELPRGVPNNLVPFVTQAAIGVRDKLNVFGDDYQTADGTCTRDYFHVVDLARAHVLAVKRLLDGKNAKPVEVFNLGTGRGTSVFEIIKAFEKVSGKKVKYEITGRRAGDIDESYCDPRLANEALNWRAELTLEEALRDAWNWQKSLTK